MTRGRPIASGAADRLAIVDAEGEHTYGELAGAVEAVTTALAEAAVEPGDRVALFVPPGLSYVASLLGTWRAKAIAVPLCLAHPEPELDFVLSDTRPAAVLVGGPRADEVAALAEAGGRGRTIRVAELASPRSPSDCTHVQVECVAEDDALILYTSGTTGRPKGVVLSHRNLNASVDALVDAWGWREDDRIVHVLPLHHTHGIVNALLCPLRVGATVELLPRFEPAAVWERFAAGGRTVFMAVPTIYVRLIREWESAPGEVQRRWSEGAGALRLMVSGSAALPVPIFDRWRSMTGQTLLERYGMTEIGMALSNPLDGERRPGHVGGPLPGVEVRLVDAEGSECGPSETGEIHVRGPGVFRHYWERPAETAAVFEGGWFRTGDIAALDDGAYRILGRASVDIIKTGGYKVSALEIENVLGGHPDVREVAVVGVPDEEWGEAVCAAVVADRELERNELREWARERLAPYKLPSCVRCVDELPKNAMGKVTKPRIRPMFQLREPDEESP